MRGCQVHVLNGSVLALVAWLRGCQDEFKAEYCAPTRIAELVKNYSQFISFPIYTWQEKTRDKEVRAATAEDCSGRKRYGRHKP